MSKAFYYEKQYYLLPQEYEDVESFVTALETNAVQVLTLLKPVQCLAPYFVTEETETVLLEIKQPHYVIATEVEVMSRADYDHKLRQVVASFCPGCIRYGNDAENLSGHYEEITLDATCYERVTESQYTLKIGAEAFWKKFQQHEAALRKLLDENQQQEATELVLSFMGGHLGLLASYYISLNKYHNRYAYMHSAQGNSIIWRLLDYVMRLAPQSLNKHWDFFAYLPKEIYQYHPLSLHYDASMQKPKVLYLARQLDHLRADLTFMIADSDNPEDAKEAENYRYICSVIGENILSTILSSMRFQIAQDIEEALPLTELATWIQDSYPPVILAALASRMHQYSFRLTNSEQVPVRGLDETVYTECMDISLKLITETEKPFVDEVLNNLNLCLGSIRLVITQQIEQELPYLFEAVLQPLLQSFSICMVDTSVALNGIYFDFIVIRPDQVKKLLREMSPLLKQYNGEYTETTTSSSLTYAIDFTLRPVIDTEKQFS